MLGNNRFRKVITSFTAVAVLCVYSTVALALPKDDIGEITVTGQVTVNGSAAVSNATIVSGSTIVTGADSSAVVNLGKNGRVEILENSNMVLNFSAGSIVGILSSGKARVSNAAGVATTVTTKDAAVIADSGQANVFGVEVECSHTHVDSTSGMVTMREGSNDRQVAAGTSATAGNLDQTGCEPCLRPNSAPPVRFGGPWWLLLVAAGVAGAAIFFGKKTDTTMGGGTIIVSPTR
jgi:hypothetical protein